MYSSAGFGGGSLYLAMLSQYSGSESFVRFTGLSCNTVVTASGSIQFQLKKWIEWKSLSLLLLCSVPLCIWSSSWHLTSKTYFIALGFCLLLAGILMLFQKKTSVNEKAVIKNAWYLYPASAVIGLLSGLTGIGGGVYLSPLLHLSLWGSAKHISAASCVFILVNSIVGLVTQYYVHDGRLQYEALWLLVAVFAGGLVGSKLSSSILSQKTVRLITVLLIIFASLRILYKHL